jgi:hypothetical protein
VDADLAIQEMRRIATEMSLTASQLEDSPLPLDPHLDRLSSLAEELEWEAASFRGEKRFSVTVHYGSVFAEDEGEAVRKAGCRDTLIDQTRTFVDGEPYGEP